ncbi:hypothetical protein [Methanobrevibacter sp.]|nr:hypothetical protein [Methanobrevibacter sp.]
MQFGKKGIAAITLKIAKKPDKYKKVMVKYIFKKKKANCLKDPHKN